MLCWPIGRARREGLGGHDGHWDCLTGPVSHLGSSSYWLVAGPLFCWHGNRLFLLLVALGSCLFLLVSLSIDKRIIINKVLTFLLYFILAAKTLEWYQSHLLTRGYRSALEESRIFLFYLTMYSNFLRPTTRIK